ALDGGASVPARGGNGGFAAAATAGHHAVGIAGPGFVPKTVRDVVVEAGKATELGNLVGEAGRSGSGRGLDAGGAPGAGARGRGPRVAGGRVAAGPGLTGGGAELYIEDESPGARATETDADGRFVLSGFRTQPLTVVAGKDGAGRSPSVAIPRGPDSVSVDLV